MARMRMQTRTRFRASLVTVVVPLLVLFAAVLMMSRQRIEHYITRKSNLYDAGVTLQSPHVRALNTGGR